MGFMLLLIGGVLAISAGWQALGSPHWVQQLPTMLIGLALAAFGYSAFSKARRDSKHQRKG
jgi:membrane protein implicated in regulation of membrane protease activity